MEKSRSTGSGASTWHYTAMLAAAGATLAEMQTGTGEQNEREVQMLNERVSTRIRFCVRGIELEGQGQPPG